MHMMITGSPHPQTAKSFIPHKRIFRMYQRQPIGIQTSKRHVTPHIARRHGPGGDIQRNENHDNGISGTPIEGIKETGVSEAVVGFVGETVEFGREGVFQSVSGVLDSILDDETECDVQGLYAPFE